MRDERSRLLDILEAIENVEKYFVLGKEAFEESELIRVWMAHQIQIIGEASANLSAEFRHQHPQIPWARIIGMRNILVHQYLGTDWQEVWDTAVTDLPKLKTEAQRILRQTS
jgi:uncharacterized protein with HEPN domain